MWDHLDLFSGIGGFSLAASQVWTDHRIVCFVEIEPFCQKVLKKHWPSVPIVEDVNDEKSITEHAERSGLYRDSRWRAGPESKNGFARISLLTAGFPCPPVSCAGKREGTKDSRWLWPQTLTVIRATNPRWIVLENVPGLLTIESGVLFENVCAELEDAGYTVQPLIVPAAGVGAWHRRDRVWIVAHNEKHVHRKHLGESMQRQVSKSGICSKPDIDSDIEATKIFTRSGEVPERAGENQAVRFGNVATNPSANSNLSGLSVREVLPGLHEEARPEDGGDYWEHHWLEAVVKFCGMVHGLPTRVDPHRRQRIKALGNAIVPQVAIPIMQAIKDVEDQPQ